MSVRIAGVQMEPTLMDRQANLAAIETAVREVSREGARLAIFPEAAVTGYCFESAAEAMPYAEPVPGPSTDRLTPLCRELGVHVVFGTLERDGSRLFNAAVLVGPTGVVGCYRKVHLPSLGMDKFTSHGDRPFEVYDIGDLRVGMLICYDGSFPEAARCLAVMGADLICLPTNWPPGAECTAEYLTNARALENNVYFAAVNRVGIERGFRFIGRSRICNPSGDTIADAPLLEPATVFADVDPMWARRKHIVRVPGKHEIHRMADRRPEMYGALVAPIAEPSPRR